jgi:putative flippase GtrA
MPDGRQAGPSWRAREGIAAQFARFLLVGLANTGIGYAVFLLALPTSGYQPAYAMAYVAGMVVAYLFNSMFVFRRSLSIATAARYPLVYVVQYASGALVLHGLVNWLGVDARWAALLALAASVPVSFVLNRLVLATRTPSGK